MILLLLSARRKIRLAKTDIVRRPSYPTLFSRRSRLVVENFNSPLVIGDWAAVGEAINSVHLLQRPLYLAFVVRDICSGINFGYVISNPSLVFVGLRRWSTLSFILMLIL